MLVLRLKETEIQLLFSGPLIIPMHGYVISNDKTITKSVPEQLYYNLVTLPMYCVFIWAGFSFCVILLCCDRMANNAEFVEYKTSSGKFPTYNQDFALGTNCNRLSSCALSIQSIIRTKIRKLQEKIQPLSGTFASSRGFLATPRGVMNAYSCEKRIF